MLSPTEALQFIKAGNATFTLRSVRTQQRYTFKVTKSKDEGRSPVWFVKLLAGPDNEQDFVYLGILLPNDELRLTKASRFTQESTPVKALAWTLRRLHMAPELLEEVELFHEGRCGRCGRKLTVPESVESGFGPECAGLVN